MPAVTRGRLGAAALLAGVVLLCAPMGAYATTPGGGDEQSSESSGSSDNGDHTINAKAGAVVYDRSKNGTGESAGPVAPVVNWTPPPCWFAPNYDPKSFKNLWTDRLSITNDKAWVDSMYDYYENGHPYTNWNLDKAGKGYWWTAEFRDDGDKPMTDTERAQVGACFDTKEFWVDKQKQPTEPNAINPKILSALAYAELRVPDTKITLNPDAAVPQTVNLPTWAWLDKATFKPVSVTASVPVLGIEATTTATPVGVTIDPGTSDADVYPTSGVCPINKDGGIGTPYTAGTPKDAVPPCGVTYRHASTSGPYHFKAVVTWQISWTGTGNPKPTALPDGTFGTTVDLTVREIQTVNR